jgi:hypothetical protein
MTEPKIYRYVLESEKFTPEARILRCKLVNETTAFATLEIPNWYGRTTQDRLKKAGRVFNTWEEAHNELMARAHRHLDQARSQLQRAQGLHGNIVGMRPPPADETPTTNHTTP